MYLLFNQSFTFGHLGVFSFPFFLLFYYLLAIEFLFLGVQCLLTVHVNLNLDSLGHRGSLLLVTLVTLLCYASYFVFSDMDPCHMGVRPPSM